MTIKQAHSLVDEYSKSKTIQGKAYSLGHIINAAEAAFKIAKQCGLDENKAYVFSLLHDIGRLVVYDEHGDLLVDDRHRHPIEGYKLLTSLGLFDEARICVTHAFISHENIYAGLYDQEENDIINTILEKPYDDYDKLVQLVDEISVVKGVCSLETRFVRQILEMGYREVYLDNFNALLEIKKYFDDKSKKNVYSIVFDDIDKVLFI